MIVGGNWNNGSNCSILYENGNNAPSNSNINIGSFLILQIAILMLRTFVEMLPPARLVGKPKTVQAERMINEVIQRRHA